MLHNSHYDLLYYANNPTKKPQIKNYKISLSLIVSSIFKQHFEIQHSDSPEIEKNPGEIPAETRRQN